MTERETGDRGQKKVKPTWVTPATGIQVIEERWPHTASRLPVVSPEGVVTVPPVSVRNPNVIFRPK